MSSITTVESTARRLGRPRKQPHEMLIKKYVSLVPADLAKLEALEAHDREWLVKAIRAAKLPAVVTS